jgi:hypothetical protein
VKSLLLLHSPSTVVFVFTALAIKNEIVAQLEFWYPNQYKHNNIQLNSLGRFESLLPVANSKVGQVAKPVKFAKSGALQAFAFEGGVVGSSGRTGFYVETSLRK